MLSGAKRCKTMTITYKKNPSTSHQETIVLDEKDGVTYFKFPLLENTGMVRHAFSTRLGGVSKGYFETMNFSFTRGDDRKDVLENYHRMAGIIGCDVSKMVLSHQTHTTNIRIVAEEDAGKGIWKDRDYENIDGLITNVPELTLVTFYADCVPLYFVDPVHRAIGLSHSGWKGTVNRMGLRTIEAMKEAFDSNPEDLLVCIGPSICMDCYEVSEDVAKAFTDEFGEKVCYDKSILRDKGNGKYQLDLWRANVSLLSEAGILKEHLAVTNVCTKCNPNLLYSHREMGDKRGNLAAFLSLK